MSRIIFLISVSFLVVAVRLVRFFSYITRVTEQQQTNMMTAENLSIVFAPTLLRSPENDDPLTSLSAVKYERELVEILVTHHTKIFD